MTSNRRDLKYIIYIPIYRTNLSITFFDWKKKNNKIKKNKFIRALHPMDFNIYYINIIMGKKHSLIFYSKYYWRFLYEGPILWDLFGLPVITLLVYINNNLI